MWCRAVFLKPIFIQQGVLMVLESHLEKNGFLKLFVEESSERWFSFTVLIVHLQLQPYTEI